VSTTEKYSEPCFRRYQKELSKFWLWILGGGVLAWLCVWSEVPMVCIWSSWCHCHSIISYCSKIQNGLPFWCRLTQVVLEKGR